MFLILLMIFVGSFFLVSFSSVLTAGILIIMTFLVMSVVYWNMFSVIPLYLFSLFMMGGLYVLIGFVMMTDIHDLDRVINSENLSSFFLTFFFLLLYVFLGNSKFNWSGLDQLDFSVLKSESLSSWGWSCGTYLFLIFYLLIFLFIIHLIMKSSWGGGGFLKD